MKKIGLLLIPLFLCVLSVKAVPLLHVLDTNMQATTSIYLSITGKAKVEVNPLHYNVLTDSVHLSQSDFSCSDVNPPRYLKLTIFNIAGTTPVPYYMDSTLLFVKDTNAPVLALKPAHTLYLSEFGIDTLDFASLDIASWDSCGISESGFKVLNKTLFYCADTGTTIFTISVPDNNGNIATAPVAITTLDTVSPKFTATQDTLFLPPPNFQATLSYSFFTSLAHDNCGIVDGTINGVAQVNVSCQDTGWQQFTVQLNDASGNSATQQVSVYVRDTMPINYVKMPHTANLIADSVAVSRSQILSGLSAGCFPVNINFISDTVFSCADVSHNPNYIKFELQSGQQKNIDSVTVTVADTQPPLLVLQTDTLLLNGFGTVATLSFSQIDAGSSDNCALDTATVNGFKSINFYCADTGINKVVVVLFDVFGNATTDSVNVFVSDTSSASYQLQPVTVYLQNDSASISQQDVLSNVTGGCFPVQVSFLSDTIFYCGNTATNPNYVKLTIGAGASFVTDSVAVTVLDTAKPQLNLQADTLVLVNGMASLTFADVNLNSTDNCALDSAQLNGQNAVHFSCADTGLHTVHITLFDINGNIDSDSVNVYVADTLQPSYTAVDQTVYLQPNTANISRADVFSNIQTSCFPAQISWLTDTVFTCQDVLSSPIYAKFSFTSGSVNTTDSIAVTVLDTIAPTLVMHTDTLVLANNAATLTFANIDAGSTDNCWLDSAQLNGAAALHFSCVDTGSHIVAVKLYDVNGNVAIDTLEIFVSDTLSPTYTKTPVMAYLAPQTVLVSRSQWLSSLAAGCFKPAVNVLSDTSFTCADVGQTHFIKFTVGSGAQQVLDSVSVMVFDTLAPVLATQSDTVWVSQNSSVAVDFSNVNAGSVDNCMIDSATVNGQNSFVFACANTGEQQVEIALYDVNGNVTKDSVSIYVQDSVTPTYTKNAVQVYIQSAPVAVSRGEILSNVSGGCAAPFVDIISDTTYTCANINTNPNYLVFKISNGLETIIDSTVVTVLDTIKPTLTLLPPPVVSLNANGEYILQASDFISDTSDNCVIDSISILPEKLTCSHTQSYTPVVLTAYDLSGNFVTVSTLALAQDMVAPTIQTKQDTVYLNASGQVVITLANVADTVFDACGLTSVSLSNQTFGCSDIGLNQLIITAIDVNGNQTVVNSAVYVLDTLKPVFNAVQQHIAYLDHQGVANVKASQVLLGNIFENCTVIDTLLTRTTLNCADVGFSTDTISVIDASGNRTSIPFNLSVADTTAPTAIVQNVVAPIDTAIGQAHITPWQFFINVVENCEIDSNATSVSPSIFDCDDVGQQSVNISLVDIHGNANYYSATVNVTAAQLPESIIVGPSEVCANAFNIKYEVQSWRKNSTYTWDVQGGTIVSTSFKGREIYVKWSNFSGSVGTITLTESNAKNCGLFVSDTTVLLNGEAPDTSRVGFWNDSTRTMLICAETDDVSYQWGYDEYVNGQRVSTPIAGETKHTYYNANIGSNIDNLGYIYWCETSFSQQCATRNYLNQNYPIGLPEFLPHNVNIWPNPFSHEFRIKTTLRMVKVELYTMHGQLLTTQHVSGKTDIAIKQLTDLPPATYVVRVTYKNGTKSTHKIVSQP